MDKNRGKRTNLLKHVDRLHVEKAVTLNLQESSEESNLKEYMNPFLLSNRKDKVFSIDPNKNYKVRKQVYMLRRSRSTAEGGSQQCELCGRMAFKLYCTEIEVASGTKQPTAEWRREETETAKVCRTCFFDQTVNKDQSTNKNGSRVRSRPLFDRSMCGLTTGRASQAWHFVRRDIIQDKTKALVNKRCFEEEFSEQFLNEESDTEESYDSETSYESEGSCEDSLHVLPFQLANKGWVTPGSLQQVKLDAELRNRKPSPLPSLSEEISIDLLLESEITMTRCSSAVTSPMLLSPNPALAVHNPEMPKIVDDKESKDIIKKLVDSFETPLDIVTEPNDNPKPKISDSLLDLELFDYFCDRPARVKRIKRRRTISKKLQERKQNLKVKKDSRTSVYDGLCKLVTVVNRKKGKYIDNIKSTTLFDTHGKEWRNKDLPSYLNLNTDKYLDPKTGFRQKKKNVDAFVTESAVVPATTLVRNKPTKAIIKPQQSTPVPDVGAMTTDSTAVEPGQAHFTNLYPQISLTPSLFVADEPMTLKEEVPTFSSSSLLSSNEAESLKKQEADAKGKKQSQYDCNICQQNLSRKSYKSYTKETTPLCYLKLFKGSHRVRICSNCNLKKINEKYVIKRSNTSVNIKEGSSSPKIPKLSEKESIKSGASSAQEKHINVTIVKNPDSEQMRQIQSFGNTKYVIVKAGSNGGKKTGTDGDQVLSEITIGGKNYKIDTEFKLNELVKENENASARSSSNCSGSGGIAKEILLSQLPSILKRTNGAPTTIKIMNAIPASTSAGSASVARILPKPSPNQHVISSLPSISLQVQNQIRTTITNSKNAKASSVTLPTNGPVKPIQLVHPHKVTLPSLSCKKRAMFPGQINHSVTQIQRPKPKTSLNQTINDKTVKKE